jgi:polysaccharide biosynthesis/export protein
MGKQALDRLVAFALVAVAAGCASAGPFVWMQDYPAGSAAPTSAAIVPGDQLAIRVWNAEQLGSRQRVREDGTIALFFAADLRVAGLTTTEVADSIAVRLDGVLVAPRVNVVIEEAAAEVVSVIGEVARPGRYPLRQAPTILAALSQAGGLTDFAKKDRIFVLRDGPEPQRIRVRYAQLTRGEDLSRGFRLHAGDVVIVE